MTTVTTDKPANVPGTTQTTAKEDVRRVLADVRFVETIDSRITERLKPIMEQLANISSALQTLTEARTTGATVPSVGAHSTTGTPKLEAEPRSPEPSVFAERQLTPLEQWNAFDATDPTTFISKANQGTTNP